MRPEAPMERWGVMSILREALRLLHNHFRLFLPFFHAFHLPASVLGAVPRKILKVASPQPAFRSLDFFKAYNCSRQEDVHVDTDSQPFNLTVLMSAYASGLVIYILVALALSAYAYILVKYISFEAGTEADNDRPIIKKVFELLPRALLRLFVTRLSNYLMLVLLAAACLILAFNLNVIWTAIAAAESSSIRAFWLLYAGVPYLIGAFAMGIMFMLAWCSLAVLEPGTYGLAFTKSIGIYLVAVLFSLFGFIASLEVVPREEIDWLIIITLIFTVSIFCIVIGGVARLYVHVAFVVAYFVFKSKFESVVPETIPRGSMIPASENPYQRVVHDSTQPRTVDEP